MLMLVLVRDHYVWSSHVRCTPLQYAGALSVYLMHILYHHLQFFSDIERENIQQACAKSCQSSLSGQMSSKVTLFRPSSMKLTCKYTQNHNYMNAIVL